MPAIARRKNTIAQLLVYYDRLKEEKDGRTTWSEDVYKEHLKLYHAAINDFIKVDTEISQIVESGKILRSMGENEAKKEQSLLKQIFGKEIEVDFTNRESVKEFIDTFNACLGLEEVYKRNVFLIQNSKGMKSVISFFPTYFLKVWDRRWPDISKKITAGVGRLRKEEKILRAIESVVKPEIEEIIPIAIEEMFTAERELKTQMPEEMRDAYKELLNQIGKVEEQGSLANQIAEIYQLDKISKVLFESLNEKEEDKIKKVKKAAKANMAQKGGSTLEAIENTVFNMIAEGLKGNLGNSNTHVYYSGKKETGFKADNIITFGIDPDIIQKALETNEQVSRERNKNLFENLGKQLQGIHDGFIVYSSDKNYTYNEGFKERGGFQAEKISLDTYRNIMRYTTRNARTFIGAILQTAEGAVLGGEKSRKELEAAAAQDIAYFLFDDFKTLGKEADVNDPKAIHIMNLDGVYIPLSFFLILVANAIDDEVGNPDDFVTVNISVADILWKTQDEQDDEQERTGLSAFDMWQVQRSYALRESKIEVHFLREFQQIIRDYLKDKY